MDTLRKVTHEGWFSRIGGALKGLLVGLLMLVLSIVLQFWNEGRTVARDAALAEGRSTVQRVADAIPAPQRDGALVHVSGAATAARPVRDEEFGVDVPALALRRRVEMYQWDEKKSRREEKQVGGGTHTVTEYRYEQDWDDDAIDSSRFEQAAGHANPGPLPYTAQTWRADEVRLGGYTLAPEVVGEIGGWENVPAARIALPPNLAASFRAAGDWFTTSIDGENPSVGDVRVRFEQLPAGPVSVVARQQAGALVTHATASGGELVLVERGTVAADAMFDAEAERNSLFAWGLRGAGFVLAWIGFNLLLRPLVVLADVVPLLGRLAGFGGAVVSGVLAALTSALGIGGGWLWHRPWLLGIVLLAIVSAAVWLLRARRAAPAGAAAQAVSMPPPPPPPHSA
jgi:hypothetical protein